MKQLKRRIALHAAPWTPATAVQGALGLTRQALHRRGAVSGFPRPVRLQGGDQRHSYYCTEAVARWLIAHNYEVVWI